MTRNRRDIVFNVSTQMMRWIYLSPHLDDAILSCGGLIYEQARQGVRVEIWTILAGDPPPGPLSEFTLQTHALWGLPGGDEAVSMRRSEDREAARIIGAKVVHFDIPDCIYRRSPQGEYLYSETVFTSPHPADRELPGQIVNALKPKLGMGDQLVCPLALGSHVDHALVRQAAESLQMPLYYYADVPYILNTPLVIEQTMSSLQGRLFSVKETGMAAWLKAVAAYQSQVASLFKGMGTLDEAIRSYWASESGLRLWRF